MFVSGSRVRQIFSVTMTGIFLCFGGSLTPVAALDDTDREKDGRKACEAKLCKVILDKPKAKGGSLTCDIGKTWGKAKIKEGADSKNIEWSFGDARCKMSLKIPHRAIVNALTKPKFTFSAPPHTVNCDVETGNGIKPVRAVFEPKIKFEGGRVKKAWVRLKEIDGPALLKGLVWTTAQLEDSLGIFHSEMVKEINKFIHKTCAEEHGPDSGKGKKEDKSKKKGEAAKKKEVPEKPDKKPADKKADTAKGGDASNAEEAKQPTASKGDDEKAEKSKKSSDGKRSAEDGGGEKKSGPAEQPTEAAPSGSAAEPKEAAESGKTQR